MNDAKQIRIKLSDLVLWDKNARLPSKHLGQSEKQLISHFCQDKDFKIEKLAKVIVKDFSLPQMERLIVLNRDGKNIVYEGNRRLIVYKLLNNPDLTSDEELRDWLKKQKIDVSDSFLLDCIVTADEDIANKYIERKHLEGNNVVPWRDQERTNHRKHRGVNTSQTILRTGIETVIRGLPTTKVSEEMKDKVLGYRYVTTLWRILDSTPAKNKYGYELKDKKLTITNAELFKKELSAIVKNVLNKKDSLGNTIDSRTLNTSSKKEKYLERLSNTNNKSKKTKNKNNLPSTARDYLIPEDCPISISNRNGRINNIYCELENSLLLDNSENAVPNAVGVLFRTFLETSLDHYLKKESENLKKQGKEISLRKSISEKITIVADYMEEQKIATHEKLDPIRRATNFDIPGFHRLVHSDTEHPQPSDLKARWDNLQGFFEILWNDLEEK